MVHSEHNAQGMTGIFSRDVDPTQILFRCGSEKVHVSVLQRPPDLVVDQIAILKKVAIEKGGSKFMGKFELQVTPRIFVTFQVLEAFGKWAIGGQEVVDAVYLRAKDVLEVRAFGDDVVDPAACPLDSPQFYDGKVRKNEDE
jgi:hypothetical protein